MAADAESLRYMRECANKLGFACFWLQKGRLFDAGLELGAALRLSWQIQNGEMHERAQQLVTVLMQIGRDRQFEIPGVK